MSTSRNNKKHNLSGLNNQNMGRSPIENQLNSDNSFNDAGLENARKLEQALNGKNSQS